MVIIQDSSIKSRNLIQLEIKFGQECLVVKNREGSGNVPNEYLYSTHVTKGGQLYLTGKNDYGQDSFNAGGAKLYKIDGSIDNYTSPMLDAEEGFDYFKVEFDRTNTNIKM